MYSLVIVACALLELTNTHTNEVVRVTPDTFAQFDHVLRDHRTGELFTMDRALYDLLVDLAAAAGREPQYEIISGYRSPATNAKLASRPGSGVSSRSLHMQGRAIDVRLKGYPTAKLRDLAIALKRGGVGYYERSDFVHLDTGRVRSWAGK
jgi:uncharacterized protein YcbK (DUF882 family)